MACMVDGSDSSLFAGLSRWRSDGVMVVACAVALTKCYPSTPP